MGVVSKNGREYRDWAGIMRVGVVSKSGGNSESGRG